MASEGGGEHAAQGATPGVSDLLTDLVTTVADFGGELRGAEAGGERGYGRGYEQVYERSDGDLKPTSGGAAPDAPEAYDEVDSAAAWHSAQYAARASSSRREAGEGPFARARSPRRRLLFGGLSSGIGRGSGSGGTASASQPRRARPFNAPSFPPAFMDAACYCMNPDLIVPYSLQGTE